LRSCIFSVRAAFAELAGLFALPRVTLVSLGFSCARFVAPRESATASFGAIASGFWAFGAVAFFVLAGEAVANCAALPAFRAVFVLSPRAKVPCPAGDSAATFPLSVTLAGVVVPVLAPFLGAAFAFDFAGGSTGGVGGISTAGLETFAICALSRKVALAESSAFPRVEAFLAAGFSAFFLVDAVAVAFDVVVAAIAARAAAFGSACGTAAFARLAA